MIESRVLPPDFKPGPFDVICARGKQALEHPGNVRFRALIRQYLAEYNQSATKVDKSLVVAKVLRETRSSAASPMTSGAFVQKNENDGLYHEIGDRKAREKVGRNFRALLHERFQWSAKAKKRRRRRRQAPHLLGADLQAWMDTTQMVRKSLEREVEQWGRVTGRTRTPSDTVGGTLTAANIEVLEGIQNFLGITGLDGVNDQVVSGMGKIRCSEKPAQPSRDERFSNGSSSVELDLQRIDSNDELLHPHPLKTTKNEGAYMTKCRTGDPSLA